MLKKKKNSTTITACLHGGGKILVADEEDTSKDDTSQSGSSSGKKQDAPYYFWPKGQSFTNPAVTSVKQGPIAVKEFQHLNTETLYKVPLVKIDCSFGIVREELRSGGTLRQIVCQEQDQQGTNVTAVFVIRRPGCASCRDHARQVLSIKKDIHGMNMIGITKHGRGVDDGAMLDFYQDYFRHPVYMDAKWQVFKALGGRKISSFKLLRLLPKLVRRYSKMGIPNIPLGGDIKTQGGVLIFDANANLRYVYYENFGDRFDEDLIRKAIFDAQTPLSSSS